MISVFLFKIVLANIPVHHWKAGSPVVQEKVTGLFEVIPYNTLGSVFSRMSFALRKPCYCYLLYKSRVLPAFVHEYKYKYEALHRQSNAAGDIR